jgi:hypothetical protein
MRPDARPPHALRSSDWKDSRNRSFPGYPQASAPPFQGRVPHAYARCWNESAPPIFVRVVDICPCNRSADTGGYNAPCCVPSPHFDLSYWAFEARAARAPQRDAKPCALSCALLAACGAQKLAHPLYGLTGIQFRAVDCRTRRALWNSSAANASSAGVLGGAQGAVYASGPAPGWGWNLHRQTWANFSQPEAGGGNVTCASLSAGGLMAFSCLQCRGVFGGGGVRVTMRAAAHGSGANTGGEPPQLRLLVSQQQQQQQQQQQNETFCAAKPAIGGKASSYRVGRTPDGFVQYRVPWAELRCEPRVSRADASRVALENVGNETVTFCLRELLV